MEKVNETFAYVLLATVTAIQSKIIRDVNIEYCVSVKCSSRLRHHTNCEHNADFFFEINGVPIIIER